MTQDMQEGKWEEAPTPEPKKFYSKTYSKVIDSNAIKDVINLNDIIVSKKLHYGDKATFDVVSTESKKLLVVCYMDNCWSLLDIIDLQKMSM